ncbi:V4R domain-containing protein [Methanolobus profundi]|uniref:V4R domain-containing protein n=1 Tax=Methanolobus profundi TaxID=487685 RepID=A0A1I4Q233_9EURY|nr:4-vinyl reductase [Methanolobus profundi]SFM33926.1 V4R domain-containing protein [Methanolobus profundi]
MTDPGLPPFMQNSGGAPPPMSEGSFGQSMGAFGAMLKLQQDISERFPKSKVPWNETRKFLKSISIEGIRSTSLYRFHMDFFREIGLGNMQLISYAPMHYIFAVPNNPVCNFYPALNNQKVCVATTDALHRFFREELELECSVEETECIKNGDPVCKFKVDLQPISAYQIMLDEYDKMILSGVRPPVENDELMERVKALTIYKLLEKGKLSEIGSAYMQFASNMKVEEKVFDPPWKLKEELSSIAETHSTFGGAFGEMAKKVQTNQSAAPTSPEPVVSEETKRLQEEAKKTDSFAELLAKMKKNE